MAWQLSDEVLHYAPRDLTRGELAVLMVIAEGARVEHRQFATSQTELAVLARLTLSGLRYVLRSLRDRGLDVRVPNGRFGADGRPLYAIPGTVVTYRLPIFRPAADGAPVGGGPEPTPRVEPGAVDNPAAPEPKGGSDDPPAIHKGGSDSQQGGQPLTPRGVVTDPPPRFRGPVDAPAPAHEAPAPAVDNQPDPAAGVPPLCPEHSDLAPGARVPRCRDCAELKRAWSSRRTQLARAELRRRNQCRACDDLGWLIGADGQALSGPAVRCRHTSAAQKVAPRGRRPPDRSTPTPHSTSNDSRNAHA